LGKNSSGSEHGKEEREEKFHDLDFTVFDDWGQRYDIFRYVAVESTLHRTTIPLKRYKGDGKFVGIGRKKAPRATPHSTICVENAYICSKRPDIRPAI